MYFESETMKSRNRGVRQTGLPKIEGLNRNGTGLLNSKDMRTGQGRATQRNGEGSTKKV